MDWMDILDRIKEHTATHKIAKANNDNIAIHGCCSIADHGNIHKQKQIIAQIINDKTREFDFSRLKNGTASVAGTFFLRHKAGSTTSPIQAANIKSAQARMSILVV